MIHFEFKVLETNYHIQVSQLQLLNPSLMFPCHRMHGIFYLNSKRFHLKGISYLNSHFIYLRTELQQEDI